MTPLVDVVLVVLVFLMLTATFNTGWFLPGPKLNVRGIGGDPSTPMPHTLEVCLSPAGDTFTVSVGNDRFGADTARLVAHLQAKKAGFESIGHARRRHPGGGAPGARREVPRRHRRLRVHAPRRFSQGGLRAVELTASEDRNCALPPVESPRAHSLARTGLDA